MQYLFFHMLVYDILHNFAIFYSSRMSQSYLSFFYCLYLLMSSFSFVYLPLVRYYQLNFFADEKDQFLSFDKFFFSLQVGLVFHQNNSHYHYDYQLIHIPFFVYYKWTVWRDECFQWLLGSVFSHLDFDLSSQRTQRVLFRDH